MNRRIIIASLMLVSSASLFAGEQQETENKEGSALYTVVDGNKVDSGTFKGWTTWRAMACERCHGPNQEGMVGPSLIESLKTLTKDEFKNTLMNGKPEKGMPNFNGAKTVMDNLDNLYAYLKGRSDGAIKPGRLQEIK